jgi:hypothetical protein
VFRAKHGGRSSDRRMETLLHRKLAMPYAVHGFRASFSSWAHSETDHPHQLIELSRSHVEGHGNAVARGEGPPPSRFFRLYTEEFRPRYCADTFTTLADTVVITTPSSPITR